MDINNIESKRLVIPPRIAAIVEDARKHPEKGHVLYRINAHGDRLWDKANEHAANAKRRRTNGEPRHASTIAQTKFHCIEKSETPQIQGSLSVIYDDDDRTNNVVCSGYLVSSASSEPNHVMIVLKIDGKLTPCLCPKDLIDFQIPATVQYIKDRRGLQEWPTDNIAVESKPAKREDGAQGHLIMDGEFKGRVVDSAMLDSLRAGCLQINSKQSIYTLDRRYAINENVLKNVAMVVIASKLDGLMKLCPAGREDISIIISIANVAICSKSQWHKSLGSAIEHLHCAGMLTPPSLNEKLFQISIGGNSSPNAMMVGKFLSCAGLLECPNVKVRCACGFTVDGMAKGKSLLRKVCGEYYKNK